MPLTCHFFALASGREDLDAEIQGYALAAPDSPEWPDSRNAHPPCRRRRFVDDQPLRAAPSPRG